MKLSTNPKVKNSITSTSQLIFSARKVVATLTSMLISIGCLTSCSKSETTAGLPESCTASSNPYLDYSASQIREAVAFAYGYDAYANVKGENLLSNGIIETNLRFANTSLKTWFNKNPECLKDDVAIFANALAELDSRPFTSKDVSSVKKLVKSGYGASQAIRRDVTYAPIPGPDTDSGDVAVPRPSDVVAKYKKYDDVSMRISIDASNSE